MILCSWCFNVFMLLTSSSSSKSFPSLLPKLLVRSRPPRVWVTRNFMSFPATPTIQLLPTSPNCYLDPSGLFQDNKTLFAPGKSLQSWWFLEFLLYKTLAEVFSCECRKIFKNVFFHGTSPMVASVKKLCWDMMYGTWKSEFTLKCIANIPNSQ